MVTPFLIGACLVVVGISGYRLFYGSERGDAPGFKSALESGLHAWPLLLATLISGSIGVYCFRQLKRLERRGITPLADQARSRQKP
jgi:hypothetical protein